MLRSEVLLTPRQEWQPASLPVLRLALRPLALRPVLRLVLWPTSGLLLCVRLLLLQALMRLQMLLVLQEAAGSSRRIRKVPQQQIRARDCTRSKVAPQLLPCARNEEWRWHCMLRSFEIRRVDGS